MCVKWNSGVQKTYKGLKIAVTRKESDLWDLLQTAKQNKAPIAPLALPQYRSLSFRTNSVWKETKRVKEDNLYTGSAAQRREVAMWKV